MDRSRHYNWLDRKWRIFAFDSECSWLGDPQKLHIWEFKGEHKIVENARIRSRFPIDGAIIQFWNPNQMQLMKWWLWTRGTDLRHYDVTWTCKVSTPVPKSIQDSRQVYIEKCILENVPCFQYELTFIPWVKWTGFEMSWASAIWDYGRPKTITSYYR